MEGPRPPQHARARSFADKRQRIGLGRISCGRRSVNLWAIAGSRRIDPQVAGSPASHPTRADRARCAGSRRARLPAAVPSLTFPNRALVGYTETLQRGYLEQDAETAARWVDRHDRLQVNALSRPDSSAVIRETGKELDHA
ncbi:Scr1 family TA system antitoxin-like transcriptional regulator [Kitasatospora sp. NBC_01300]|uniref:Scr1 family TA system antitoxin-like transcriptional regulator n=1 Tax=Kitasatospora sp. NBC_01300 TaxID=2903574 RepID=UPI00352E611D